MTRVDDAALSRNRSRNAMISVGGSMRSCLARAIAALALLVFAWQGATAPPPRLAASPPRQTTATAAELAPARIILPLAPVQVAKPAPPEQRRMAAPPMAVLAVAAISPAPAPAAHPARDRVLRPAARLSPPYAARGPPLFS